MEQIINANGSQYGLTVNPDGSINTVVSGINIDIGSAIINLEDVYVRSGVINSYLYLGAGSVSAMNPVPIMPPMLGYLKIGGSVIIDEVIPTDASKNNPSLNIVYSGNVIGSIFQYIGTGSYVRVLSYTGANLTGVSAWEVI